MKICIVEDNKPLLENLRLLLEGEPGFSVTGAYPSAEAALREMPWGGGRTSCWSIWICRASLGWT